MTNFKKIISLVLVATFVFSGIPFFTIGVNAASNAEIQKSLINILYKGNGGYMSCDFDGYKTQS